MQARIGILNFVLKRTSNGPKKVRALGVWLSTNPDVTISLNNKDKIENTKLILGCWKLRRLSLLGKITVLKSLIASQLVYIFSPLETNHAAIKYINVMFSLTNKEA